MKLSKKYADNIIDPMLLLRGDKMTDRVRDPINKGKLRLLPLAVNRRLMADRTDALLVCQREFGLVRAPSFIKTVGFNSCVITTFFDPVTKTAGIAHFDIETDVAGSFEQVVVPAFKSSGISLQRIRVRIAGGEAAISDKLRREIRDQLQKPGQKMKIIEIDLFPGARKGLIINVNTGEICELTQSVGFIPERFEEALKYLLAGKRLLRNVGFF